MKQCLKGAIIGLILCATLVSSVAVLADIPITVEVNGSRVNFEGQPPEIVDGRTLVPVRGVFEQLGFDVEWDGDARQVRLGRPYGPVGTGWQQVILTIDSVDFSVYTEIASGAYPELRVYSLEVPAQIVGGRTMLPIRAVLESVGYYLNWDGATRIVLISSTPFANVEMTMQETPTPEEAPPAVATGDVFDGIVGRWFFIQPGSGSEDMLNEVARAGTYDGLGGMSAGIWGGNYMSVEILSRENGYITVRGTLTQFHANHREVETRHEIREVTVGYILTQDGRTLATRQIPFAASPTRPPGAHFGAGHIRIFFTDGGIAGLSASAGP
ncbi:MAG: copper amine oxidase N-terminal domain-containing protein [Defluviitaleaceae bacterium]|nr:copper amine oxidase N-terminal domain-containing protein [Defluviitaleaceae bacterium]